MQQEIYNNSAMPPATVMVEEQYASYEEVGAYSDEVGGLRSETMLDKLPRFITVALVFLLPIFFLPMPHYSLQSGKALLLGLLVSAALIIWAVARLKEGTLNIPSVKLAGVALLIPASFAISTIFSPSFQTSFIGTGAESGTLLAVLVLSALLLLVALTVRTTGDAFTLYAVLLMAFVIAGLYQILRLSFGFDTLTFGFFTSSVANLVGKWNDFGVFSGLATLVSLLTLELVPLRGVLVS
jgi:hypothetical protein